MNPEPSSSGKILRLLFLTLLLRGRSSRGLQKEQVPKSVASKLALTLLLYGALGLMALFFHGQPVFALALYLHGMTLVFLGMFIAASAGEVLFNKEEAEILLHRPIRPQALLWAKIGVLIEVSWWLAGAFNFVGFFVGITSAPQGWLFPLAHAVSTSLEALFCTGFVVLGYELCLRWFGRDRLEGLMTTVQVLVSVAAVLGGQLVPQLLARSGGSITLNLKNWWIALLPPAWFAGLDDVVCGSRARNSWPLAGLGLAATAVVLWLAFGRLARDYGAGLQALAESSSPRPDRAGRRRWLARLVAAPPLSWWLRNSVSRASFLLTTAYLFRDRETKLRIYPSLAPILVMPAIMIFRGGGGGPGGGGTMLAFTACYLAMVPLLGIGLLRYSQQWQASDLFRVVPLTGPAQLCDGTRRAVLLCVAFPIALLFGVICWILTGKSGDLFMMLPGLLALPVFGMVACLGGRAVPLSLPTEEAKATNRAPIFIASMVVAGILAGLAGWARTGGWFWWLIGGEIVVGSLVYTGIRSSLNQVIWSSLE